MSAVVRRLLDLVYPRRCVFCRRILEREPGFVCDDCLTHLPPAPEITGRGEFYQAAVGACSYVGSVREAVIRFKFSGASFCAEPFGALLADAVRGKLDGAFDLITFVPISRLRRRGRGYDQAELLAQTVGSALGMPVVRTAVKVRHTGRQSRLSTAAARRANVQNAYRAFRPEQWAGKRLLLIDDILTTGATVSEVSRVLLSAGAKAVVCGAFAVTPLKESS